MGKDWIDRSRIPAIAPDQTLYPVEKLEAHRLGLLHQAVSVFLFDGPAMLIQRRAAGKYHCPLLWANACCSHPHFGESLEACAQRRLDEELGITVPLGRARTVEYRADVGQGLWEHERVAVFHARVDRTRLAHHLNHDEVAEIRWVTRAAVSRDAVANPDRYAPWLRIYLARWDDLGIDNS